MKHCTEGFLPVQVNQFEVDSVLLSLTAAGSVLRDDVDCLRLLCFLSSFSYLFMRFVRILN